MVGYVHSNALMGSTCIQLQGLVKDVQRVDVLQDFTVLGATQCPMLCVRRVWMRVIQVVLSGPMAVDLCATKGIS